MGISIQTTVKTALTIGTVALATGTGAVAGALTSVGALGGAVFGATSFSGRFLIQSILDKTNIFPNTGTAKAVKIFTSTFAGIGVGVAVASAIGFPVTFATGLGLTLGMISITLVALPCILGCVCCAGAGVALRNAINHLSESGFTNENINAVIRDFIAALEESQRARAQRA